MDAPRFQPQSLRALVDQLDPDGASAPSEPAKALAALMDPRGSVRLAEWLGPTAPDARPPLERAAAGGREAPLLGPEAIRPRVRVTLDALTQRVTQAFKDAFKPRYRLPKATRFAEVLGDVPTDPSVRKSTRTRALERAARTLWAPFNDFIDTWYKRARYELQALRVDEVGYSLRAMGPQARALETLDAALRVAIATESEARYRRLLHACNRRFAEGLDPTAPPETPLAPGGAAVEAMALGHQVIAGVIQHERALIESLVEAALRQVASGHYGPERERFH